MVSRRLRTLALLLAHPGEDSLEGLVELAGSETWLQPAVTELQQVPLDIWQAEHTRLFINGYPGTVSPPFESAYRHGQFGGSAIVELRDLYLEAELGPTGVPTDYLGTELEFAAWLVDTGDPLGLFPILWKEHLALWLPGFCSDLAKGARLLLYKSLAAELEQLVEQYGKADHDQLLGASAS